MKIIINAVAKGILREQSNEFNNIPRTNNLAELTGQRGRASNH